jgi:hypothetical protein
METTKNFPEALDKWLVKASEVARSELTTNNGQKYVKIIQDGSAFCFIDKATGDVLKAASWSAPAKHARGNIYSEKGLGVDRYGAHYIR